MQGSGIGWGQDPGLALVGLRPRIISGKHVQGSLIESEAHVLGREVQHANGIIRELCQIWSREFFLKKVTEGKPADALLGQALAFFCLTVRVLNGHQVF